MSVKTSPHLKCLIPPTNPIVALLHVFTTTTHCVENKIGTRFLSKRVTASTDVLHSRLPYPNNASEVALKANLSPPSSSSERIVM